MYEYLAVFLRLSQFRYGRAMEPAALEKYKNLTGNQVYQTGILVSSHQPWLAGSPDGLVDMGTEKRVLEIKCPASNKDQAISVPYVTDHCLKKTHDYYYQVQILLYLTGLKKCDFFIFSKQDSLLLTIERDDDFL